MQCTLEEEYTEAVVLLQLHFSTRAVFSSEVGAPTGYSVPIGTL
jgi:hypothetical protein